MKTLIDILKKLLYGVIYGLGFSVGVSIFLLLFTSFLVNQEPIKTKIENINTEIASRHKKSLISKVKIIESDALLKGDSVEIIGKVENSGTETIDNINIGADLFDIEANIVHICRKSIIEIIKPMEIINFKINCSDIPEEITNFVAYEVKIINN